MPTEMNEKRLNKTSNDLLLVLPLKTLKMGFPSQLNHIKTTNLTLPLTLILSLQLTKNSFGNS